MSQLDGTQNQYQSKTANKYFDIHPPVFWPAALLTIIFIATTLLSDPEAISQQLELVLNGIADAAGWWFILLVNFFVVFCLYLAFSKFGSIRLGGKDARPEFSMFGWFSMLFSAGMGIGIIFWSVGEPVMHYDTAPVGGEVGPDSAQRAMQLSFLHWGLHAWGIYALMGLALAFFAFNKGLPLSLRSVFYPVLGDRIKGTLGDVIDVIAVLATLFGLATSLGFGVTQISAGLNYLGLLPDTVTVQILLISVITLGATASVVSGLDKGVQMLSKLNLRLGAVFLVFMLFIGPTLFIFDSFVQNLGYYIQSLLERAFWTEAYRGPDANWQNSWTVFYWAWWISWSPFVGTFIARVSKGRTIREFILGVLIVPSLLTFLWISAFGGSALQGELFKEGFHIVDEVNENVAVSLFALLEQFPLSIVSIVVALALIASFFVTSSDSGSLVVDTITAGGKLDAPVGQRIFWALSEGGVAAVLLYGGGLEALQTAAITTGLPFSLVMVMMCYSLYKGLETEHRKIMVRKRQQERRYLERQGKQRYGQQVIEEQQ
jgi:choline/glycine/proline betaine transport protein